MGRCVVAEWKVTVTPPDGEPVEVILEPGHGMKDFDVATAASHAGLTLEYHHHGVVKMKLDKTYG